MINTQPIYIIWLFVLAEVRAFVFDLPPSQDIRTVPELSRRRQQLLPRRRDGTFTSRRRLQYNSDEHNEDDDYYPVVDENNNLRRLQPDVPLRDTSILSTPRNNARTSRDTFYDDSYDLEEDGNEEDDGLPITGNYWSNPVGKLDKKRQRQRPVLVSPPQQQQRRRRRVSTSQVSEKRLPPSRTSSRQRRRSNTASSIRTGAPKPPGPVRDFYNRLFWFGLDQGDDGDEPSSTLFGGTKGKFNGLAYLNSDQESLNRDSSRRRVRTMRQSAWDDDDDYYDDKEWQDPQDSQAGQSSTSGRTRKRGNIGNTYDWASREVSTWFGDEETEEMMEVDDSQLSFESRRRGSSSNQWSPQNALDSFFGLNRQDLQRKARLYNSQMGIGSERRKKRGRLDRSKQRSGYTYPIGDDINESSIEGAGTVVDVDPLLVAVDNDDASVIYDGLAGKGTADTPLESKSNVSWEERSLAIERVPPSGIPSWGGSGELSIDARTKSIIDALEDILEAKRKLRDHEKRVELAKEEVSILRVDAELERKRLTKSRGDTDTVRQKLRQLEFNIQDASRALRLAKSRLQLTKAELADLEARHWAVLSFYNPNKITSNLEEALREFEDSEPAVKRPTEKRPMAEDPGDY